MDEQSRGLSCACTHALSCQQRIILLLYMLVRSSGVLNHPCRHRSVNASRVEHAQDSEAAP